MVYGDYIKQYNNVSEIARMFLTDFIRGINSFDYLEEISSCDLDYTKQVLEDNFKEEKMVFSVIKSD